MDTTTPKKRGRPALGAAPMTAAERQKRVRERRLQEGLVDVQVYIDQALVMEIDALVKASGRTRSEIIQELLREHLARQG